MVSEGCYCTQYVTKLGKTRAELHRQTASRDSDGNIVCEVTLIRRSLNQYNSTINLGNRYLILNAPSGQKIVEERIRLYSPREYRGKRAIQIPANDFSLAITNAAAPFAQGWFLYPSDISNTINSPILPAHLKEKTLSRYSFSPVGSEVPFQIGGTNYVVDINVCNIPENQGLEQAKWAYPLKVLVVPAFVVDVITFPIQYIHFCRQFRGWTDGSGQH